MILLTIESKAGIKAAVNATVGSVFPRPERGLAGSVPTMAEQFGGPHGDEGGVPDYTYIGIQHTRAAAIAGYTPDDYFLKGIGALTGDLEPARFGQ